LIGPGDGGKARLGQVPDRFGPDLVFKGACTMTLRGWLLAGCSAVGLLVAGITATGADLGIVATGLDLAPRHAEPELGIVATGADLVPEDPLPEILGIVATGID
jgi:hypothetical protein